MSLAQDKTLITQQFMEGVHIFQPGDDAHQAFLIDKGSVGIYKDVGGESIEIAVMKPGDIFGEMALLQNSNHTARATALEKTNLVIITEKALKDKLKDADPLIAALVHMFVKRLQRSTNAQYSSKKDEEKS